MDLTSEVGSPLRVQVSGFDLRGGFAPEVDSPPKVQESGDRVPMTTISGPVSTQSDPA